MSVLNKLTGLAILIILASCTTEPIVVQNAEELKNSIENAKPGDQIIMANGVWKDIEIVFTGKGTEREPIMLKAETPGEVFIEGESSLKFGGEYLVASGLYFRNGHTPGRAVVQFKLDDEQVANYCRLTNSVIDGYNQLSRDRQDLWVEFFGRHNQMDHCYLAGKANRGPTVRVDLKGNKSINNYHQIVNNHFGPRPRKGGPQAESLQLGSSYTSMSPSYTMVANNLFERCNGEVEVISSKTNFNEFRNNVFYKSEGSLVTRHGNYCTIDGNWFIGDESNEIGGVRLVNTGHKVTNNYFFNLKGSYFKSPFAIMNGIPRSPLNRYNQVTDVVVAYNTWINCTSPWRIGIGANLDQKDVLPISEIRSARPIRTTFANNVIYNEKGDSEPLMEFDKTDGILFASNYIANQGTAFKSLEGLTSVEIIMKPLSDYLFVPDNGLEDLPIYNGFDFESITYDLVGQSRGNNNVVGAISIPLSVDPEILDYNKYGASWFTPELEIGEGKTIDANTESNLAELIMNAESGDIISLQSGIYSIENSLKIDKTLTIQSATDDKAKLIYSGAENSALFEMNPKGDLRVKGLSIEGNNSQYAFASLKENMSSLYNLDISNSEISKFKYVLKAYKQTFSDAITFAGTKISDCENGIELSEEIEDKGNYNVEFLTIKDCEFNNVQANVIDYYRGGYDESTIGGNLLVSNNSFTNCGAKEANGILLNTRGIVNVEISNNSFKNNRVKLIALLWGAKNNTHSENEIISSGEIRVEENIKLNLMY